MSYRAVLSVATLLSLAAVSAAQPFVAARNAQCIAISPDGKIVATGISGMSSGTEPLRPHPSPRKCAEVQMFDAETAELIKRVETFGDLTRLAFSGDGKYLAASRLYRTADGIDLNEVRLWSVPSGMEARAFERTHAFDFAPDGASIVVASGRSCAQFDLKSGERKQSYKPLGGALAVRFTPDGKRLIGIVHGDEGFALASCSASSGELEAQALAFEEPFYSLDVSSDGQLIATGHDGGNALVWKADTLQPVRRFQAGTDERQHVVFSPDGSLLALAGQKKADVVFYDVASGREVRQMHYDHSDFPTYLRRNNEEKVRPETAPARFAFSPDGKLFLAGCGGGVLRSMESGNEVQRVGK